MSSNSLGWEKKANSSHLKMVGWKMILSFWDGLFSGALAVSFREGTPGKSNIDTKNDVFLNVSPFKYGYFGYPC